MKEEEASKYYSFLKNIKRVGDRTIFQYIKHMRRLPLEITQDSVNKFISDCKNTDVARAFMKSYLVFTGLHKNIDLPPRRTGTEKKRLFRPIPPEEWKEFIDGVYAQSFKDGMMFEIIYQGALRRVEIPTIRINSFHWSEWFMNIHEFCKLDVIGKGDKERTVLINPETAEKLFSHYVSKFNLEDDDKIQMFINSSDKLFGIEDDHERKVNDLLDKYSIKFFKERNLERNIRPHELRKQRATELLSRGVPMHDIKNYLGHSNVAITEKYIQEAEGESISNIQEVLSS